MRSPVRDKVRSILALWYVGFVCGLEAWIMTHGLPEKLDDALAGRVLGGFDTIAMLVMSYYFASSQGGEDTKGILASMMRRRNPVQDAGATTTITQTSQGGEE